MSDVGPYQVVILDPAGGDAGGRLQRTLRQRVADLGLEARKSVRFFDHRLGGLNLRAPVATVYFGGPAQRAQVTRAVEKLQGHAVFILPAMPSLDGYTALVPPALHSVNGMRLDPADPALEAVAAALLEELGLMRKRRRVFISYRRDRTRRAAVQLYHALDARSFDVFLDTHGVARGELFQSVLWDRMSDTDLLILLDAPGTLDSKWVGLEMARAHQTGIGILQLIWPGHTRAPETHACHPEYLDDDAFHRGPADRSGGLLLRKFAIDRIVATTESLRARSIAARRSRLVGELCAQAALAGLKTHVQPARHIDVTTPAGRKVQVYPILGSPDAVQANHAFDACRAPPVDAVLLYDATGVLDAKVRHIEWLDEHLPAAVRLLRTTNVLAWARGL